MESKLFEPFTKDLLYGVSDRHGGVSEAPYDTLNVALHVGDQPIRVLKNREILSNKWDFILQNLIYMDQVHGNCVEVIEDPLRNKIEACDALITDLKNIPLMVMVADCVPLLFFDPSKRVIGVAHAGRNGTLLNIAQSVIDRMQDRYGVDPADLRVHIGTSIGVCCYEVGEDIADIVKKSGGEAFVVKRSNKYFLDLKEMNHQQLLEAGVRDVHIEISPLCTVCEKDFFSYRREGRTGRFCAVMMLR